MTLAVLTSQSTHIEEAAMTLPDLLYGLPVESGTFIPHNLSASASGLEEAH
jgi:hypothetical protein